MKFTKLSLIATLAISSACAGGDIAPVEPMVEEPAPVVCNSKTTINAKAQAYYYSDDSVGDLFDTDSSALGLAATVDVSHEIMEGMTANITAVGYTNVTNLTDAGFNFEGWGNDPKDTGAIFNVANITNTMIPDTTIIAGRQLLDTPMLGGFDWLLAPGAFKAYTVVNKSISNVTLVGSYVEDWRINNTGDDWIDLTDIDDGNNWTIGASYSDAFDASVWYYNVDAGAAIAPDKYTQIYVDAGYDFGVAQVAAQYVDTDFDIGTVDDSSAFGVKASTSLAGFDLMAAYANVSDNYLGYIGRDTIYTSSWNTFTSNSIGDAYKFEAATELFGALSTTASYAYYEYDDVSGVEEGSEIDLILGYGLTDCISLDAIYTNTDYGDGAGDINALELIATYKF